jgi:hypothetical protein
MANALPKNPTYSLSGSHLDYDWARRGRLYFDPGTMLLPYETYARSSCPAER